MQTRRMVTGALVTSVILRSVALAGPFTYNCTNYPHLWSTTTYLQTRSRTLLGGGHNG
jgi:hypothetical protein